MSTFSDDVRAGLSREGQKQLPCEYLYDDIGTALFEAITVLPEYGLTRADARLIRRLAPQLCGHLPGKIAVAELGSGGGTKTRRILEALDTPDYYPIDLSTAALAHCERELSPFAKVHPIAATYLEGLRQAICARRHGEALLVLFLGSTIGNFPREAAEDFLRDVRSCLRPDDSLLLGADLIKPLARMLIAYDDPSGVTAAFNRNLLARINRELNADFALRSFVHEARWDPCERRIEMHLRSLKPQRVHIRAAQFQFDLRKDETIWTESCHKFYPEEILAMAEAAGFTCRTQWLDDTWPFAESLLIA